MHTHSLFLTVCLAALMVGCAVGPDFKTPLAPDVTQYDSTDLPAKTEAVKVDGGDEQSFEKGEDIPSGWWSLFHSDTLNDLITKSIQGNPDLAAAQASLRVAQESAAAGDSVLFPTVTGDFSTARQKTSSGSSGGLFPGQLYTLHNASVSVSYGLDLWGQSRRAIEELDAQTDYQRFQLEAAYLSLTANVVTTAIQEASLRGQIDATNTVIDQENKQLKVLNSQLELGGISRTAVLQQEATLAQTRATLPPLEKQLAITRHQLSALAGQYPSDAPKAEFSLKSLKLPSDLPVTLPSKLVEQRPDIRAAEANLHYASAAIGVAIANRLPQITLSADMGSIATNLGKLFTPGMGFWSMGFDAAEPLFDAGKLEHEEDAARAEYDMAAAQYRKTVIAAFQDVADTLRAIQSDTNSLKAQAAAEKVAADSLRLAEEQYKDGSISYLSFLTAERTEQQTKIALVQAEAQRYADTAALFQALGGGWWNRPNSIERPAGETNTEQNPTKATPTSDQPSREQDGESHD